MLAAGRTGTVVIGADGSRCGAAADAAGGVQRARRRGCWCSARSTSRRRWYGPGKFLGYRVTVCDARPVFATPRRFPDADEVVVDWPHRYLDAEVARRTARRAHRGLRPHP